jgi:ABC-2 type transport system ATP-binding protein
MEEADQLCDRVAIMDHGRLLALDTPAGLKRSIGTGTEVRIQAEGDLVKLAAVLEGMAAVVRVQVTDGVVHAFTDSSNGVLSHIIREAELAGFAVRDVGVTEPTLETVFIDLTGRELRE